MIVFMFLKRQRPHFTVAIGYIYKCVTELYWFKSQKGMSSSPDEAAKAALRGVGAEVVVSACAEA